MKRHIVKYMSALFALFMFSMPMFAHAAENDMQGGNELCPVGLVSGLTLDQEFGPGTSAITRCVTVRHHVRVVVRINRFCDNILSTNATCTSPYGLGNLMNAVNDYEITAGMKPSDFKIVVIAYASGGLMLLKGNKFQSQVEALMADGIQFKLCQNTARGFIKAGLLPSYPMTGQTASSGLIPGVEFVTAGVTATSDYQLRGYALLAP